MDTTLKSNNWMISNNFKIDIPKLPIGIFSDIGVFKSNVENKVNWGYNVGIFTRIAIKEDIIGIYLPILYSNNFGTSLDNLEILQRISFIFNLNNINPFHLKKTIEP